MTRAIVLSGGGSLGGFEVGVLKFLEEESRSSGELLSMPKILCGVSVGAIIAGHLSMYSLFYEGVRTLVEMFCGLKTSKIYRHHRPFSFLQGLCNNSLYDSSPLISMIKKNFDAEKVRKVGNKLIVGAVSLNTGKYVTFDESHPRIADAIVASSAFPMMFGLPKIDGQWYVDGGVRTAVPIAAALEAGATDIDMILTEAEHVAKYDGDFNDVIDVGPRVIALMAHEIFNNDIAVVQKQVEGSGVKLRIIRPQEPLNENPLDFSQDIIGRLIEKGYETAKQLAVRTK